MTETNFKHTDLGLIPHDWEVKTLRSIIDECNYGVGAEAIKYNGDVKYLRITDIDDESHHYSPKPLTSPAFYSECHLAKSGDLFVARTGASVGKSYLYNSKDGKLVYAGFLIKVHISEANPYCVFLNTLTQRYNNWVISESARTGQPGLNAEQLKTLLIPLPPTLAEQERIAGALSSIDTLIGALTEQIEKKRHIKQGAMQQLLTGKKRLAGFTGEWKSVKLEEILSLSKGKQVNGSELNESTGYPMMNGGATLSGYYTDYNFEAGRIIISEGGNSCGYVNYMAERFWAGGHCYVMTLLHEDIDSYIYHTLKFNESKIMALRVGSGLPNIQSKSLLNFEVLYCSDKAEQSAIATVLSRMDTEIAALEQKRDKYIAIKSGMMQNLLTGKIRLV